MSPKPPDARLHPIYFHQSAGAVVMIEGRCLALRRDKRDEWVFPKGHIERGEDAAEAARREVLEETGLEVEIVRPLGATRFAFGQDKRHRKRVEWFLARPVAGELALEPIFAESALLDADEARVRLTHAEDRRIAERAFRPGPEVE